MSLITRCGIVDALASIVHGTAVTESCVERRLACILAYPFDWSVAGLVCFE